MASQYAKSLHPWPAGSCAGGTRRSWRGVQNGIPLRSSSGAGDLHRRLPAGCHATGAHQAAWSAAAFAAPGGSPSWQLCDMRVYAIHIASSLQRSRDSETGAVYLQDPHYFLPTTSDDKYLLFGSDQAAMKSQFLKFFSEQDWRANQALQVSKHSLNTSLRMCRHPTTETCCNATQSCRYVPSLPL